MMKQVWIHKGQILVIPLVPETPLATGAPSLQDAISFIQSDPTQLYRSIELEAEAYVKLKKYAANVSYQFHEALVKIPRTVAYLLHKDPAYISPATEAFYLRDLVSMKLVYSSSSATVTFPPEDLVTTSVRFTRVGYAQLKIQEFLTPPSWNNIIETMPEEELPQALLGTKLTCGFEMLVSDKMHKDKRAVREIRILLEDLESGNQQLPSDEEIVTWSKRDDDDSWMNIDFDAFEKELAGKSIDVKGFGDKMAQENLRRMVSRMDEFLKDEDAGIEGAEMDVDRSDGDGDLESSDEDEEMDPKLDSGEFKRILGAMMGVDEPDLSPSAQRNPPNSHTRDADESDDDEPDLEEYMASAEAELRELGIFGPVRPLKLKGKAKAIPQREDKHSEAEVETDEEDVNVNFTVAQNLLEAFKAQGGMPGPVGNLMGLMGVNLPPDKDDGRKSPGKIR
jgi:hypothetical protein